MMNSDLVKRATWFATLAHGEQKRKYSDEPYVTHPIAVARIIHTLSPPFAKDCQVLAAAILHDVVEDTPATLDSIELFFGHSVADLVEQVTDISQLEDGNRAFRKAMDRGHLRMATPGGATIKVADLIHNAKSIIRDDKNFARVFIEEMKWSIGVLEVRGACENLLRIANEIVNDYEEKNNG